MDQSFGSKTYLTWVLQRRRARALCEVQSCTYAAGFLQMRYQLMGLFGRATRRCSIAPTIGALAWNGQSGMEIAHLD
jgi:hypothetical protein